MKLRLIVSVLVLLISWVFYSGFSSEDEDPRWNPRTRINLLPEGSYQELPQTDFMGGSNEPRYISTPQGVFLVNPSFRVHPNTTGTQSEVPITRHPTNPLIMFASANTFAGGNFSTGSYATTNGGTTWFGNDTLKSTTGSNIFNSGDPGPVIDGNGRIIMSFITNTFSMGASYSTNNGTNWANVVTFPGATTSADKNFSGTDDATISPFYLRSYTVYTEFGGAFVNRIVLSYTTNGGVSWSSVAPVSPVPIGTYFHQGADVRCGPNGEVYVVWTIAQNASPFTFTEDSLGFAKSTNGGVSWVISRNNVANVNGNRANPFFNGIRVAGFPRIDVDRTCGARAGWIYVVVGEKSPGVAGDISDIVLYKSTNGGVNWSTGVRVNQDAFGNGKRQYMGAIRVDESGGVNVIFYDTRNTPSNDSAEVFVARSTDGGVTFTELKVSDHKFRPAPISGTAGGYSGDYIGITSALVAGNPVNGNQRIWPYWASNGGGVGRYQAWTSKVELLPSRPCAGCENFSSTLFTPDYFYLEYTGTQYWTRQTPNAYGAPGSGSARFNSWTAAAGVSQSLSTEFQAVGAGMYLTFDNAYGPWSGGNVDSLIVESSTNGGASYTALSRMWGGLGTQAGPLNTVFVGGGQFTPTSSQWAPKIFALPVGTNKVRLRGRSGNGNDIWIDNVCIQPLSTPVANSIGIVPEGMWLNSFPFISRHDTVRVYLHRVDFPNIKVDSAKSIISDNAVANNLLFNNALSGTYFKVVKHRNCIETWSKAGGEPYTRGGNLHFNFLTPAGQAFGNNQKLVNPFPYYAMFSGDVDQDYIIDASDISLIENAVFIGLSGYVREDLTGDDFVDASDLSIVENNVGVERVAPLGAEPLEPPSILDMQPPVFENELMRQKYAETIRIMREIEANKIEVEKKKKPVAVRKQRVIMESENVNKPTDSRSRAGEVY